MAGKGPTKIQIVLAQVLAHEAYLSQIGSGAAIRAAGHPQDNGLVGQAGLSDDAVQSIEQVGQVALGLGHGLPAGGERHTGQRSQAQGGARLCVVEAVAA